MASRDAVFRFIGEDKNLGKTMKGLGRETGLLHGQLGKLAGAFAGGIIGAKAISFLKDSVGEAREAQKISALTEQVVKSTGAAAKVTAKHVGDLSAAISNKVGIDDEAIQSGANLLLTFTGIRNEVGKGNNVFDQATSIITDMSVALGTDVKGSAIQVGKALNDPIKGVTALTKVGVSFTDQQKKQIKALVDSGNTLGAQKVILKELGKEFGGAAAASTTAGDKMKVAFGNLEEQVGTALLPVLDSAEKLLTEKVIPAVSGFVSGIQDGTGPGGEFASVVGDIGGAAKDAWKAAQPIFGFVADHPKLFEGIAVGAAGLAVSMKAIAGAKGALGVVGALTGKGGAGAILAGGVQKVYVVNMGAGGLGGTPVGRAVSPVVPALTTAVVGGAAIYETNKYVHDNPKGFYRSNGPIENTLFGKRAKSDPWAGMSEGELRKQAALFKNSKSQQDVYKHILTLLGQIHTKGVAAYGATADQIARSNSLLRGQAAASAASKARLESLISGGILPLTAAINGVPKSTTITFKVQTQVDAIGRRIINSGGGTPYVQGKGGKMGLDVREPSATVVNLHLDGKQVARSVSYHQANDARQGRRNTPP